MTLFSVIEHWSCAFVSKFSRASAYSLFFLFNAAFVWKLALYVIFHFSASVRRLSVAVMPYLGSEETVRELRRALSNPNVQSEPLRYRNTILKVIRLVPSGHRRCVLLPRSSRIQLYSCSLNAAVCLVLTCRTRRHQQATLLGTPVQLLVHANS